MICFSHQLKIFKRVILAVSVAMVNYFRLQKKPSQMLLHNQAMFHHVALAIGVWMVWGQHGVILLAAPISDPQPKPWVCGPPSIRHSLGVARLRAELLTGCLALGASERLPTRLAPLVNTTVGPSIGKVAGSGTIFAFVDFISVKRENASAFNASSFHQPHNNAIAHHCQWIEERYCEIAAKRLAQEVLPL